MTFLPRSLAVFALLALLAPATALAERYRIDLILFGDRSAPTGEASLAFQAPNLKDSIEPYDAGKLKAVGIELLPDESFGLGEAWSHLRNSKNHQLLLRLAWLQKDPPEQRGPSLRLHVGEPFSRLMPSGGSGIYPVDGTVALLAGHFLHVDAELVQTQDVSGELRSYRLKEKRRVKRDELHHIDSPRLGLLVRVQRVDDNGTVKPAPKKPAGRSR